MHCLLLEARHDYNSVMTKILEIIIEASDLFGTKSPLFQLTKHESNLSSPLH